VSLPTNDEEGAVHYQISVTGRQAALFFLALLVSLGLSFFFGMKTGAAAKRGVDPGRLASNANEPVETPDRSPTTPPEKKLGFEDPSPTPSKPSPTAPVATPAPEKPRSTPPDEAPEKPTPTREAPAPAPTEAPKPTATPAPKKEVPLFVQVLATQNAQAADALAAKLKTGGFKADVSLVAGKPGWFRVRVGPYPTRPKAEAALKKIQSDKSIKGKLILVP